MALKQADDNNDEPIFFIRNQVENHIDPNYLLENRLIGIHFTEEFHENFEDYSQRPPHFASAHKALKYLGDIGGLVVAQYHRDSFHIGEVDTGTKIKPLNVGERKGEADNFLKTLKLSKISNKFYYRDYPLLSALRPPYITIRKLSKFAKNFISHLHCGTELKLLVSNLHPQMLEQMCDEWLRSKFANEDFKIRFELLKTGKTLPVIDMYAETTKGKSIYVQITHTSERNAVKQKAKRLSDYISDKEDTIGLFISPIAGKEWIEPPLNFVSIENIFDTFKADPDYNRMLHKMIGIKLK